MKKILLIIAIVFCIFQMIVLATAIDIGSPAINRDNNSGEGYTYISQANPANLDGKIRSVEIWCGTNLANCEVATFFVVSGNNLSTRDSEVIGTVVAGAKRTFAVNLDVEAGDYIGIRFSSGTLDYDTGGTDGYWYLLGDYIPCTNQLFTHSATALIFSLYGTGETVGIEWNGVTITKWNGIEITTPLNTQ